MRSIAAAYFEGTHRWLPIVSRKSFFACLLNPLARRRTELSLLALCMQLCCTTPPDEDIGGAAKMSLYLTAKRFHFEVEATGALSIHVLQAAVLIALYEIGHAIYPVAYLTVGACARYAFSMRLDRLGPELMCADRPQTWAEVEERRRLWWSIRILDRCVNCFSRMWARTIMSHAILPEFASRRL